ncbi:MAG: transglutaminase-like domain-containing protein [Candidatus Thorarchaeota archaeon]
MRLKIEMQANIHNRGSSRIKDGKMVWFLLTDMANQFVSSIDVFPPARVVEKAERNMVAVIKVPDLSPGESFSPSVILRIDTTTRDWLMETVDTPEPIKRSIIGTYCRMQKYWETEDSLIQRLSEKVAERSHSDESYAREAMQVVRESVKLKTYLEERRGAARAVREREGDCDEHADLFIALTRAVQIPSRRVVGHYFQGGPTPEPHAWCELFLDGKGWVPVDPALGRFGVLTESYFSRIRQGLVSERPTIQFKYSRAAQVPVDIEEDVTWTILQNGNSH